MCIRDRPLVVGLGSAFVGMFAAIKIAKFIELMDNVKNANSIFSKLITVLYDHNSVFKKVIDLWINGDSKVKALKKTWSTANKLIADTGVWKSLAVSYTHLLTHLLMAFLYSQV